MVKLILYITLTAASIGQALADDIHLLINGHSIHMEDRDNYNENNTGLGLQYDFEERGGWINLINFSTFKDSNNETSRYIGFGTKARGTTGGSDPWHFDIGAFAFVMTRKDYRDNQPFFGVLPFVSFGSKNVGLNVTYVPAVSDRIVDVIYIQGMIRFGGD